MFGGLKKKLQEAVKKVTGQIEEPTPKASQQLKPEISKEQTAEPIFKEEPKIEEPKIEQPTIEEPKTESQKTETVFPEHIHREPEGIKKIERELEEIQKEEKQEQMIATSPFEEEVKEIIKEEEKIYDREQEVEKKIDKIKERIEPTPKASKRLEEEVERDNKIQQIKKIEKPTTEAFQREEKKKEETIPEVRQSRFESRTDAKGVKSLFKKITEKKLTEDDVANILKELEMAMMENDVAVEVVERISSQLKKELVGASVKRGDVERTITEALRKAMFSVLGTESIDLEKIIHKSNEPVIIMMLGFNGVGKTTTLSKLAYRYKNYSPVLAAGDTFRAASIEQLEEHSRRLDVKLVKSKYGADSAAVIFDAKKHASAVGSKVVFADTAGRSHTNVNLMDELKKVVRVNKPDLKVLVLDALAGNDIYEQARLFDEAVGVDAIILTKSDVYDRGGAALSAAYALKKPILFLGTGQEYSDLVEFSPEVIVKNLLE